MSKCLLIVDDSRMSRMMIKTIINKHYPDWAIIEAANGEEALEKVKDETVNIMTLDLNMPGMDGLTLGKKLHHQFPSADIALITANIQGAVQVKAEEDNLKFIAKPISEDNIMSFINSVASEDLHNLTLLEKDAITETFNIGICRAAASLSEMVSREVNLSVPKLTIVNLLEAQQNIASDHDEVSGVQENFDGAIAGNALLIFPKKRCIELIRLLYPPDITDEMVVEIEQDSIMEIGNIILNSCIASLSEVINEEIINCVPKPFKGQLKDVVTNDENKIPEDEQLVLQMHMTMSVKDLDVVGDISFIILLKSINRFRKKLAIHFGLPLQ